MGATASTSPGDTVHALLERSRRYRVPGVVDGIASDIHTLRNKRPTTVDVLPTIRFKFANECGGEPVDLAASHAEFATRLADTCPLLTGFDLKAHGMVLAGGCPSSLMLRPHAGMNHRTSVFQFADQDLFLVGHADDAARVAAIQALGAYLGSKCPEMVVVRNSTSITFRFGEDVRPVQVVLRGYSTLAEVLHGFDIGACAVAWDGARVWYTGLGAVALEHGLVFVCLDGRRHSYEHRLAKYCLRGFGIVLSHMDPALTPATCIWDNVFPGLSLYDTNTAAYPTITTRSVRGTPGWAPTGPQALDTYEAVGDGMHKYSHAPLAVKNAMHMLQEPPVMTSLVASHVYAATKDVIAPASIREGCGVLVSELDLDRAVPCVKFPSLGCVLANTEVAHAFKAAVRGKIQALDDAYGDTGVAFPIVFRGVDVDTLLTSDKDTMSLRTWYGKRVALFPQFEDGCSTGV